MRTFLVLLAASLTPALADEASCTYCYQDGVEARQRGDFEGALRFFLNGCERNDGASCREASVMISNGEGAPEDDSKAVSFGIRGCDLGYWKACNEIGLSLINGSRPEVAAKGREQFMRACEGGNASSCGYLGAALRDGLGGDTDVAAANRHFEWACENGSPAFCSDLAVAVFNGTGGLDVDIPRAAALFRTACDSGWEQACENAEVLAKNLRNEGAGEQQDKGWSFSGENVSFSTRSEAADDGEPSKSTTIGSMQIGQGDETATFSNVQSSCGMFRLTVAFGAAAAPVRRCLGAADSRRVALVAEDGRIIESSVVPDDKTGRCVIDALGRARIDGLTCRLEADVSR